MESDGGVFEADWLGAPGAGIPSHTHPSQQESLRITQGTLPLATDGEERLLGPGDEVVIPAGVEHTINC